MYVCLHDIVFDSIGYYGEGLNAIIVFSACYLPDSSCTEYHYIMENLFLWVWVIRWIVSVNAFTQLNKLLPLHQVLAIPLHSNASVHSLPLPLNHTEPPTLRYVVSSLEMLVAEDYLIIYMNGGTPRSKMPGIGWLKKCYQMIDRRYEWVGHNAICLYPLCDACMTQIIHNNQVQTHVKAQF